MQSRSKKISYEVKLLQESFISSKDSDYNNRGIHITKPITQG